MIYTLKRRVQKFYKFIIYKLFILIYGKILGVKKKDKNFKFFKINLGLKSHYNLYEGKNCRLYTDRIHNTALISNNYLLDKPSFQYRIVKNKISISTSSKNFVLNHGTPRILKKLKGTIFSMLTGGAGNDNFFHWMFDVLPRLAILERKFSLKSINFFLLPDVKKKFQIETLNLLKIPTHKRLSSKSYRHLRSNRIIMTSHPYVKKDPDSDIKKIPRWVSIWLRKKFLGKTKSKKTSKFIYISREDSDSNNKSLRKIINEKDVQNYLKDLNFDIVLLSKLNFSEQVNIFRNASIVVGLHGAGFANIVFCRKKTLILELKPFFAGNVCKNLAIRNNLRYKSITVPESQSNNIKKNQCGEIYIDLKKLRRKLSK